MLVLSRKKNQSIVIDGGIEIQVLQLKGGTVKIGISAPNDVKIVRGELNLYSDMISIDEGRRKNSPTDPFSSSGETVREDEFAYEVGTREEVETCQVVSMHEKVAAVRNRVVAR